MRYSKKIRKLAILSSRRQHFKETHQWQSVLTEIRQN
jgi:hypothetical protein